MSGRQRRSKAPSSSHRPSRPTAASSGTRPVAESAVAAAPAPASETPTLEAAGAQLGAPTRDHARASDKTKIGDQVAASKWQYAHLATETPMYSDPADPNVTRLVKVMQRRFRSRERVKCFVNTAFASTTGGARLAKVRVLPEVLAPGSPEHWYVEHRHVEHGAGGKADATDTKVRGSYVGQSVTFRDPAREKDQAYQARVRDDLVPYGGASSGLILEYVPAGEICEKKPRHAASTQDRFLIKLVDGTQRGKDFLMPARSTFFQASSANQAKVTDRRMGPLEDRHALLEALGSTIDKAANLGDAMAFTVAFGFPCTPLVRANFQLDASLERQGGDLAVRFGTSAGVAAAGKTTAEGAAWWAKAMTGLSIRVKAGSGPLIADMLVFALTRAIDRAVATLAAVQPWTAAALAVANAAARWFMGGKDVLGLQARMVRAMDDNDSIQVSQNVRVAAGGTVADEHYLKGQAARGSMSFGVAETDTFTKDKASDGGLRRERDHAFLFKAGFEYAQFGGSLDVYAGKELKTKLEFQVPMDLPRGALSKNAHTMLTSVQGLLATAVSSEADPKKSAALARHPHPLSGYSKSVKQAMLVVSSHIAKARADTRPSPDAANAQVGSNPHRNVLKVAITFDGSGKPQYRVFHVSEYKASIEASLSRKDGKLAPLKVHGSKTAAAHHVGYIRGAVEHDLYRSGGAEKRSAAMPSTTKKRPTKRRSILGKG